MNRVKITFGLATILIILISCNTQNEIKNGEGFVDVNGGKIWYRITGQGSKTPVLMLHGGPGSPSYYLNPLSGLGKERHMIMFDQLGCGRSDRITDTTLMTVDSYVEQIKKLLDDLGIKKFYLYGHSWGSMLGTEYYLKHPDGIKAMILSSPILSSERWAKDADTLISFLPDSISAVLKNYIKGVQQDSSAFNSAMNFYIQTYGARKRPLSPDFDSTFSQNAPNVMEYLWGTSEFIPKGTLKNYNRVNALKNIHVPVLYIIGQYDEVRPNTAKYYQSLTPDSYMTIVENAGHMTMQDNPSENIKAIDDFLTEQDKH